MPEWLSLYFVLCWLRCVEYVTRRPAGSVVFRGPPRRGGAAMPRDGDTLQGGFALGNPLHPFQGLYVSETALDGDFDVTDLERRLAIYRKSVQPLLRAEVALLIHLFVALPIVWSTVGIARAWPYLLGSLIVLHLAVLWTFFRAYRQICGASRMAQWSAAVPFLLAPPMATAAHLAITKTIARGAHPVAAAFQLCDDQAFRDLAFPHVRRSEYPVIDGGELPSETPNPARDDLLDLVRKRLGRSDEALEAPARKADTALAYCPRCLAEYAEIEGTCVDCAGVPLKPF